MAFEGSSKRYQCGNCQQDFTWFQLMNNTRKDNKATTGGSEASKGAGHQGRGGASSGAGYPGRCQLSLQDREDQQESGASRVCASCELRMRTQEWDQLPAAFRAAKPDYATFQGVRRDQKTANKGRLWNSTGHHIFKAKQEIQQGCGLEASLKGSKKKKQ